MTISFTDVERPTVTRTSEPNPFTELAAMLKADEKLTKGFTLALTGKADDDAKTVAKAKRHLSLAGKDAGVTLRSTVQLAGSGAKSTATFSVWAVARIEKVRKPKAEVTDSPVK